MSASNKKTLPDPRVSAVPLVDFVGVQSNGLQTSISIEPPSDSSDAEGEAHIGFYARRSSTGSDSRPLLADANVAGKQAGKKGGKKGGKKKKKQKKKAMLQAQLENISLDSLRFDDGTELHAVSPAEALDAFETERFVREPKLKDIIRDRKLDLQRKKLAKLEDAENRSPRWYDCLWRNVNDVDPFKVDPKSFLANERTFLKWLNTCSSLIGLGTALISFASNLFAHVAGLVFIIVGLVFMIYASVMFRWRAAGMKNLDVHGPWDDPIGPVAIVFATAVALTLNFVVGIVSGKFSDHY